MKNLKSYLTAIVFTLAGAAMHANAATENHRGDSGICFQLTPLAGKGTQPSLTENGSSRTPLGQQLERLAEDGYSRTPQGIRTQAVASNGFDRAPLGQRFEAQAVVSQA